MQKIEIVNSEACFLCGSFYEANEQNAKASILICPAMGITAKYYAHLCTWLSEQGYNVLAIDYRGTGLSEAKNIKKIDVNLFDWCNDISNAGKWLKQNAPHLPIVFFGHSIGSQLFGFIENEDLFDRVLFVASSTGYWKDGVSYEKWKNLFLLYFIIPLSNALWGYTNAKFFGQGENYPKGVSMHWRKWCLNPEYLAMDIKKGENNFEKFDKRIISTWFTDDSIANDSTTKKLLSLYTKANTERLEINPKEYKLEKIGHSSFLSRKMKDNVWQVFLSQIEQ